jgi:hypothetical protein
MKIRALKRQENGVHIGQAAAVAGGGFKSYPQRF